MRTVTYTPITLAAVAALAGQYITQQARQGYRLARRTWAVITRWSLRTFTMEPLEVLGCFAAGAGLILCAYVVALFQEAMTA